MAQVADHSSETEQKDNPAWPTDADFDYLREVAALDLRYIGETILVWDCKVIDHSPDHEALMKKLRTVYKDISPIIWVMARHDQPEHFCINYGLTF